MAKKRAKRSRAKGSGRVNGVKDMSDSTSPFAGELASGARARQGGDVSFPDPLPMPKSGALERLTPLVRRLVAPNASPYTATGTCTYIVGNGDVVVVDPGPDDLTHLRNLMAATEAERIRAIVVTHSHRDHVGLVAKLKRAADAEVL